MWSSTPLFPFMLSMGTKKGDSAANEQSRRQEQKNENMRMVLSRNCSRLTGLLEGTVKERWLEDYTAAFNGCVDTLAGVNAQASEYKKQSIIISACSGGNKLFDYFNNLIDFYNRIKPEQGAEKIAVKAYGNYIFVIRCMMKDLIKDYEAFEIAQEPAEISKRKFLREECADQELLKKWQDFRKRAVSAVLNTSTKTDVFSSLLQESEQFEVLLKRDKAILCEYMLEKTNAYNERKKKMQEDIDKGKNLYQELSCLLTEELFNGLDPDAQDEFTKDIEQVMSEYKTLTDAFSAIIKKYSNV